MICTPKVCLTFVVHIFYKKAKFTYLHLKRLLAYAIQYKITIVKGEKILAFLSFSL